MESVGAKVARAEEHLCLLKTELDTFVRAIKHHTHVKTNPANGAAWIVFYMDNNVPSIRISTIIGDYLHNLRSALDNLVCGLIRANNASHDCDQV